jgi:hypothetical protein
MANQTNKSRGGSKNKEKDLWKRSAHPAATGCSNRSPITALVQARCKVRRFAAAEAMADRMPKYGNPPAAQCNIGVTEATFMQECKIS